MSFTANGTGLLDDLVVTNEELAEAGSLVSMFMMEKPHDEPQHDQHMEDPEDGEILDDHHDENRRSEDTETIAMQDSGAQHMTLVPVISVKKENESMELMKHADDDEQTEEDEMECEFEIAATQVVHDYAEDDEEEDELMLPPVKQEAVEASSESSIVNQMNQPPHQDAATEEVEDSTQDKDTADKHAEKSEQSAESIESTATEKATPPTRLSTDTTVQASNTSSEAQEESTTSAPSKSKASDVAEPAKDAESNDHGGTLKAKLQSLATPQDKFTVVFDQIWDHMLSNGWQVVEGRDTMFVSMPGVQFFNFRANVNVFDTKEKAIWKFISLCASEPSTDKSTSSDLVWDLLWQVVEHGFGWYTLNAGPEIWIIRPNTRFDEFKPNVTMFQTKKNAVLKCLEDEKMEISLGESADGPQVIRFYQPPQPKSNKKTKASTVAAAGAAVSAIASPLPADQAISTPPSTASRKKAPVTVTSTPPSRRSAESSSYTTPTVTGTKRKAAISMTKATPNTNKKPARKTPSKSTNLPKRTPAFASKPTKQSHNDVHIQVPEFKCTFGLVYQRLQQRGWYHRSGKFEYDYFSPEYTKENAIVGFNFFHSQADFEEHLKDSGIWRDIEQELRDEHEEMVHQMRQEARERQRRAKLQRQQKLQEMKERQRLAASLEAEQDEEEDDFEEEQEQEEEQEAPVVPVKKTLAKPVASTKKGTPTPKRKPLAPTSASSSSSRRNSNMTVQEMAIMRKSLSFSPKLFGASDYQEPKITMGKVIGKLTKRGWFHRPGRFEYDYFKPGVNPKTAELNVDFFQSEADLEMHLKMTGQWEELAREIQEDHYRDQEEEAIRLSTKQMVSKTKNPVAVAKYEEEEEIKQPDPDIQENEVPNSTKAPQTESFSKPQHDEELEMPSTQVVEELTDDIWANSHHYQEFA